MKADSEHIHQVTFVNWFREKYPDCLIFAIANGEFRHASIANRLKSEGVVAGIPDLCCLFPMGKIVWIEMKKEKGGRLSHSQKEIHKKMEALGQKIYIANGYKKAIEIINSLSNL